MFYSLRAKGEIKPNEALCKIPEGLCFISKTEDILSGCDKENSIQSNLLVEIATKVCLERNKRTQSFFAPFLDVLPEDVSYIPALWPTSKVKSLLNLFLNSNS